MPQTKTWHGFPSHLCWIRAQHVCVIQLGIKYKFSPAFFLLKKRKKTWPVAWYQINVRSGLPWLMLWGEAGRGLSSVPHGKYPSLTARRFSLKCLALKGKNTGEAFALDSHALVCGILFCPVGQQLSHASVNAELSSDTVVIAPLTVSSWCLW